MRKLIPNRVKSFSKDEKGATIVEYAVLVGIIAAAAVGFVTTFGSSLSTTFGTISHPCADPYPHHTTGSN